MRYAIKVVILAFFVFSTIFSTNIKADEIKLEPGQETHKVVTGDTLWDISGEFYKDKFLWPVLWSRNPEIRNPHLIYPEEIVNLLSNTKAQKKRIIEKIVIKEVIKEIPIIEEVIIEEEEEEVVAIEPVKVEPKKVEPPRDPTIGDLIDKNTLASAGYLTYTRPEGIAQVQKGLDDRIMLQKGDQIYVDQGSESGLQKGNEFMIISYSEVIVKKMVEEDILVKAEPKEEEAAEEGAEAKAALQEPQVQIVIKEVPVTGYVVEILGELIIDEIVSENQSIATLTEGYAEVDKGNSLIPIFSFGSLDAKIIKDVPEIEDMKVVASKDQAPIIGKKGIVYFNKGKDDRLKAGYTFSVYREGSVRKHPSVKDSTISFPDEKVGEATVIYTRDDTATAVISSSSREILIADRVQ